MQSKPMSAILDQITTNFPSFKEILLSMLYTDNGSSWTYCFLEDAISSFQNLKDKFAVVTEYFELANLETKINRITFET